jgi:hypothetical protein
MFLLPTVTTNGELGTIANWQQHVMTLTVTIPGREIERLLNTTLPAECWPAAISLHQNRIIVPTVRTSLRRNENLRLKVILPHGELRSARLFWRMLGEKTFRSDPLVHINRAVWRAGIQGMDIRDDIEYYIETTTADGVQRFPASAPDRNATIVVY